MNVRARPRIAWEATLETLEGTAPSAHKRKIGLIVYMPQGT